MNVKATYIVHILNHKDLRNIENFEDKYKHHIFLLKWKNVELYHVDT